ncbi:hypothetical protein PLICRDRAFT_180998 [Plicaturopsis crispa FD-325 SS-3]|uniref:Uncharacterized protein n=1 Tax=Plicaturopsis crispa FD-325 SS-3 TaxID=944288 RepID=A0A0C9T406_PLICR|nr:hypothetical protein PLICRDRAFT_180998 [Plicaturopsis crispa FD-325 SS-3]
MPATAGNENISHGEMRGSDDSPARGVSRLRAPDSAPIDPSPSSRQSAAARKAAAPKRTSNDVGEFNAIGAGAAARVVESVNDDVERARGRERVMGAAIDDHGRGSTNPRRAEARRRGIEIVANAHPFKGMDNRASTNDDRRDRRDARTARYASRNEWDDSLANDERTTLVLVFIRMIANDHCRCAKARAPGPIVMIIEDEQ